MNKSLIDRIEIAKQTEKFYLSDRNNSSILVKFNAPIKDDILFKVIRKPSYQETLNFILANIRLYLSICSIIKVETNGSIKEYVGVGVQHRNSIISSIKYKQFTDYTIGNSYIGKLHFNI
jgi:hypothetical protein